jgi:hypothetical protein
MEQDKPIQDEQIFVLTQYLPESCPTGVAAAAQVPEPSSLY